MKEEYKFEDREEFLKKLEEVLASGISPRKVNAIFPHPDHEVEEIFEKYVPKSKLKFFTLLGGLSGTISGFALTILTVLHWPLITGGKPLISIPAFIVIAFEMTILFGALASVTGFVLLSRIPNFKRILYPEDYGNEYVLQIEREDQ
ncbi:MAG: DUF3341 domain-containing protein [Calditrichaeota bacterium]|nr:DUF3341 domain-containing protein [Calditrichota bacterium]